MLHTASKEWLNVKLEKVTFNLQIEDVQNLWNEIENKQVTIADKVAPLSTFTMNQTNMSRQATLLERFS